MLDKTSISEENKANLPKIKRIISRFSTPDTMRFSDFKDFLLSLILAKTKIFH